jgi:Flp pilus assembly pilin Flp
VNRLDLLRRLMTEEGGQGIVEYSLMIGLVVLIIWVAVNASGVTPFLSQTWNTVESVITAGPS